MRSARWSVAVLASLLMIAVGACSLAGSSRQISIENATDIPLMLHVNGAWVGTYAPGVTAQAPLDGHGGPPFQVTVMAQTGSTLASWLLDDTELARGDDPGEGNSVDTTVPCGWIRLWIGEDTGPAGRPSPSYAPCP